MYRRSLGLAARALPALTLTAALFGLSGCQQPADSGGGSNPTPPAGTVTAAGLLPADAKEAKCPVMTGSSVNIEQATKEGMYADHEGNRYFFCCAGCPEAFKKDPAKYASAEHITTPTN